MPQTVVIDASYVLAFLLPDERSSDVDELFDEFAAGKVRLIAPQLLPFEVLNALRSAIVQKRLTQEAGRQLALAFLNLEVPLEEVNYENAFTLSLERKVSVYDTAYLLLAKIKNVPLMTLDKRLI